MLLVRAFRKSWLVVHQRASSVFLSFEPRVVAAIDLDELARAHSFALAKSDRRRTRHESVVDMGCPKTRLAGAEGVAMSRACLQP